MQCLDFKSFEERGLTYLYTQNFKLKVMTKDADQ